MASVLVSVGGHFFNWGRFGATGNCRDGSNWYIICFSYGSAMSDGSPISRCETWDHAIPPPWTDNWFRVWPNLAPSFTMLTHGWHNTLNNFPDPRARGTMVRCFSAWYGNSGDSNQIICWRGQPAAPPTSPATQCL
jgi:hypothetical protein